MKTALIAGLLSMCLLSTASAQVGSAQIIKQRAKDLRNQNNAQQGVAPVPQPAAAPAVQSAVAAPAATPVKLTTQQQSLLRLNNAMTAITPGTTPSPQAKQNLARELGNAARGSLKPKTQTTSQLAESLASALSQKLLSNATKNRLLKDLDAVLNPGAMGAGQLNDVISDVQSQFEANRVSKSVAGAVAADLRAVAEEVRPAK